MFRKIIIAKGIEKLLQFAIDQLDVQTVKEFADDLIDKVEDRLDGNQAAMASIAYLRKVVSIPDDIGGDED